MKHQVPISLALALMLATTDSEIASSQQPTVILAELDFTSKAYYLPSILLEAEGRVELKREQWKDYLQIDIGTELYSGNLLRVAPGVKVRIRCADGILWRVPADGDVWGLNNGCLPVPSVRSNTYGPR